MGRGDGARYNETQRHVPGEREDEHLAPSACLGGFFQLLNCGVCSMHMTRVDTEQLALVSLQGSDQGREGSSLLGRQLDGNTQPMGDHCVTASLLFACSREIRKTTSQNISMMGVGMQPIQSDQATRKHQSESTHKLCSNEIVLREIILRKIILGVCGH